MPLAHRRPGYSLFGCVPAEPKPVSPETAEYDRQTYAAIAVGLRSRTSENPYHPCTSVSARKIRKSRISNPSQGWGGFFNPLSEESRAALGGLAGGLGQGSVNMGKGVYKTGHDVVTLPIDMAMTGYGIYDPTSKWTPISYYGSSSEKAIAQGTPVWHIQTQVAVNACTLGGYGLGQSAYDYYKTGDATRFQEYTGAFATGTFLLGYATGRELSLGRDFRIAPFGNRTGHPYGRFPHYHRRVPDPKCAGQSLPGQGIGRHRPWEPKATDKNLWDHF